MLDTEGDLEQSGRERKDSLWFFPKTEVRSEACVFIANVISSFSI